MGRIDQAVTVASRPRYDAARARKLGLVTAFAVLIVLGFVFSFPLEVPMDFVSFIASSRAAPQGLDPYWAAPETPRVLHNGQETLLYNLNPPLSILLFLPLAPFDLSVGRSLWYGVSLGMYLACLALLHRAYPHAAWPLRLGWALILEPALAVLRFGQIHMLLLLAATGAWLLLRERRDLRGGLLLGVLAALKPNFLVWPALLLLSGHRRAALSAFATAALLSAAPALIYGPHLYDSWWRATRAFTWMTSPTNASLLSLAARLGVEGLGMPLAVGLLLLLAAWAWRCRPSAPTVGGLALVASLLASPVSWITYSVFLVPVLLTRQRWGPILRVSALLTTYPVAVLPALVLQENALLASASSLAPLLVLVSLLRQAAAETVGPRLATPGLQWHPSAPSKPASHHDGYQSSNRGHPDGSGH